MKVILYVNKFVVLKLYALEINFLKYKFICEKQNFTSLEEFY